MQILIRFTHGLGDAVQATVVLRHLAKYRPDWVVDVWSLRGKHSAFSGLCRRSYHDQEPAPAARYDQVFGLGWFENYNGYADRPNSKITNCLDEVFGLAYDPTLGRYTVTPSADDLVITREYLRRIGCVERPDGRLSAAVIHYQGNTSGEKKNLDHDDAAAICAYARSVGLTPIVLDWDRRSPLSDDWTIFRPAVGAGDIWGGFGSGDAARITALIQQAAWFVGIDSGPGKCASATDTPTLIVWTGHHPIQFHDPAPNTVHLIPSNHGEMPPAHLPGVRAYFERAYRHRTYERSERRLAILNTLTSVVSTPVERDGMVQIAGFWAPKFKPEQSWIVIEDVYLRDAYKTRLRPRILEGVEYVVDIGANIGAFTKLWHERNPDARIASVEVCPELIGPLAENVGDYAEVLPVACRYGGEPLYLLSSFTPGGRSTGGSRVVGRAEFDAERDQQYRKVAEPVSSMTLEQICEHCKFPRIDALKLDCEGSEFDILRNCDLSRIGTIFVESHGADRWRQLLRDRFAGWDIGHMSRGGTNGDFENWHLVNPRPPS